MCGGQRAIFCETMKKAEYDERVAEKADEIQDKIDEIIAHIMDKQNAYIEFIKASFQIDKKDETISSVYQWEQFENQSKTDPRYSVDVSLNHLLELNANYEPKFETEYQIRSRECRDSLDELKRKLEQRQEQRKDFALTSNESSPTSSPEPSKELESVKNLIQTGARKMSERAAGFKNLWASFRNSNHYQNG